MSIINISIFIIGVIVGYLILDLLINSVSKTKKDNKDEVIEWYGPEIYLREKKYDIDKKEMDDSQYYKEQEKQRVRNVKKRNGRSNTGTNTSDGDGSPNNTPEDESKRT